MFETLFEASPFPVYLCKGVDLIVTIANQATLKAWGKNKDVIGKPFLEALPELHNQPFRQLMLNVYHTGIIHSAVDKRADLVVDGTLQTFYFTFSYHPFREPDGELTGVFCFANDVTELVKARHRLEASEESARLAIEAARLGTYDAIVTKTLDGVIDSWNEAAVRMFGYTSNEMIGNSVYALILPEYHEEEEQILARLRNGERLEHFETKRLRKDGKQLDISLTISPIKNNRGEIIGISKIARDITEQKMAEMRKNDFITIASHELKTPLTTIKSYVQLLLAKARNDQDNTRMDALSRVDKQITKMSILIQNFLDNARLLEGKLDLILERFNTYDLLLEILGDARILFPSHLIVMKQCENLDVTADRTKICQVMENLIGNAVKYSPVGSTITISCKIIDNFAQISVSDTGIGIEKKDQTKLFDRFYRVENEKIKNAAGFGIGLYLVAEILRRHHSNISVESVSDVGSRFYFNLPIATNFIENREENHRSLNTM